MERGPAEMLDQALQAFDRDDRPGVPTWVVNADAATAWERQTRVAASCRGPRRR
jgi:hypothetical protein